MHKFELPYFGEIDLDELKNKYYLTSVHLDEFNVDLCLSFNKATINTNQYNILKNYIDNIEKHISQNKVYLKNDFVNEKSKVVKEYLKFQSENLKKDTLLKIIGSDNSNISQEEKILNKLQLNCIYLFPHYDYKTDSYATFDYAFDGNEYINGEYLITDIFMVVKTNKLGNLYGFYIET